MPRAVSVRLWVALICKIDPFLGFRYRAHYTRRSASVGDADLGSRGGTAAAACDHLESVFLMSFHAARDRA